MLASLIEFFEKSGFVGIAISITGVSALIIVIERVKKLYFDYSLNVNDFTDRIQSLIAARKFDDALLICQKMEKKPLAAAFKNILAKSDREEEALYQASDIALAENIPLLSKRIHFLSMIANVATLLGLLGTIRGLIHSFQALAFADPAQKQIVLSNGIAESMNATALGLAVAIPVMVSYSFLVSRQNQLSEQLFEKVQKLVETLVSIDLPSSGKVAAFPTNINVDQMPPPANIKAKAG